VLVLLFLSFVEHQVYEWLVMCSDSPDSSCVNLLIIEDNPIQVTILLTLSLQACLQDGYESLVKPVVYKRQLWTNQVYLFDMW